MPVDQIFAIFVVVACAVMLLRLALGERRRRRFDAGWLGAWQVLRTLPQRLRRRGALRRQAERAADEAIRRAQGGGDVERDGNVYTPKSFGKRRRDLH